MMNLRPSSRILRILLVLGIMSFTVAVFADDAVKRLSEPVVVTDTHEFYGATLPDQGTPMRLDELINAADKYQGQEVLVATRIAKVCQKKGCFFVATQGAATARVSFKDYGFFIPTDSGGKDVLLLGTFSRTSVSVEEAEHYATDLGEAAESSPEDFQYSIVASAVQIPR
jgi:hypothetical protein